MQVREVLGLEQVVVGQADEELAEIIADGGQACHRPVDHHEHADSLRGTSRLCGVASPCDCN